MEPRNWTNWKWKELFGNTSKCNWSGGCQTRSLLSPGLFGGPSGWLATTFSLGNNLLQERTKNRWTAADVTSAGHQSQPTRVRRCSTFQRFPLGFFRRFNSTKQTLLPSRMRGTNLALGVRWGKNGDDTDQLTNRLNVTHSTNP